ncbi:hypothetical protein NQ317_001817 [Molorchus minor]|uniref:RNA polymerase I-specific transcription initiation factor RRN3 n=1 Tax=Molorchus minor TaxID=1323400 RepID=A0ABQ9J7F3_9CUCU|nr:hypothetical protein NQ317_001817 [Molorchus minor]
MFVKKSQKSYENLLCLIRDAQLTDNDVSCLLKEATECISLLNQDLRLFVEALLSIEWINKKSDVVSEYQSFVVNLVSAHNYHAKIVIEKLVKLFLPAPTDAEWIDGGPPEEDCLKCLNVHTLLNLLLAVVPMCKELLMNSVISQFPYYNKSTHVHEYYLHNILWILDYQPSFRQDMLHLVLSKIVIMDVNAPKEEIERFINEDEEMFVMDDAKSMRTSTTSFTAKVCNPNVAPVIRQAAVNYIASLSARANYIPLSMLKGTLQQMAEWIHSYISNQDGLECVNSDVRLHLVFYSVCQALFYIVSFRYKDLIASKKNIVFLESLNMAKMVTSRLNPLKVCQPPVVQKFAAITRKYQLAYCYTVIENNSRNTMPTIYQDEKGCIVTSDNILDAFYPFDPFILERSGKKIEPFYRHYESIEQTMETDVKETSEVDDFLCNQELSTTPNTKSNKFLYGSSPGFKYKG